MHDARLGQPVCAQIAIGLHPRDRRGEQDAPGAPPRDHLAGGGLRGEVRAAQVDAGQPVEGLRGVFEEFAVVGDAGIGDDHIQPAMQRRGLCDQRAHALDIGYVAGGGADARRIQHAVDALRRFLSHVCAQVVEEYPRAGLRECLAQREADALARSGDDDDMIGKGRHRDVFLSTRRAYTRRFIACAAALVKGRRAGGSGRARAARKLRIALWSAHVIL